MKSQVKINAEKDANYCPYCMRCSGNVRMVKKETMLWGCHCGAIHDERFTVDEETRKLVICYDGSPIVILSDYHHKLPSDVLAWYAKEYAFDLRKLTWALADEIKMKK